MANLDEEDYLESLLKSMSSDSDIEEIPIEEPVPVNTEEMDNFDTFSINENDTDINTADNTMPEDNINKDMDSEDLDSQLLSQMLLNDSVENIEPESVPEVSPEDIPFSETETEKGSDIDDTSIEDMLRALQEKSFDVDEEQTISEPIKEDTFDLPVSDNTDNSSFEDELADILALDDGMSIEDIPEEVPEGETLSAEETEMINNITVEETSQETKPKNKKKKKKINLRNFFMKFDDSDDDSSGNSEVDKNQQLIDEVYNGKETLADEKIDSKEVKAKKKKEKKPKKEKTVKEKKVKEKKVKEPKPAAPQQIIPVGTILKTILVVAVLCSGIIVSSKIISYNLDIKNAKDLYSKGSYSEAYEILQGMDIRDDDKDFYMKSRIMASLCQGIESYDNYMKIDDETLAIAALVTTVSRKFVLDEDIIKYEVDIPAQTVYARVLSMLEKYGISEQTALDLNAITNYSEFITKISTYGGISQ